MPRGKEEQSCPEHRNGRSPGRVVGRRLDLRLVIAIPAVPVPLVDRVRIVIVDVTRLVLITAEVVVVVVRTCAIVVVTSRIVVERVDAVAGSVGAVVARRVVVARVVSGGKV
jgi:hypothetical protein